MFDQLIIEHNIDIYDNLIYFLRLNSFLFYTKVFWAICFYELSYTHTYIHTHSNKHTKLYKIHIHIFCILSYNNVI